MIHQPDAILKFARAPSSVLSELEAEAASATLWPTCLRVCLRTRCQRSPSTRPGPTAAFGERRGARRDQLLG